MAKNDRYPEIVIAPEDVKRELRRRSRRDFLIAGLAAAGGIGGYEWVTHAGEDNGVPWPQRRVLRLNEKIAHAYLSNKHLVPEYSRDEVTYLKPNGDIGMTSSIDKEGWRLEIRTPNQAALQLGLSDVTVLPRIEMTTRFCCIEGWSAIASWIGVRFSDFTRKYFPPAQDLPSYVYMATPDEEYYVGLDMKSAMHPQTLLAYELNGKPLTDEHGAPLRLVIPVKYGIKNIKRIGLIQYTTKRPGDYWAEEGYDWFAGL